MRKDIEENVNTNNFIEEAPVEDLEQYKDSNFSNDNFDDLTINDYISQKRQVYLDQGVDADVWREHRSVLYLGNLVGLSNNEIDLFAAPDLKKQQKLIILFLLFAKLIDKNIVVDEFLTSHIPSETMLVKIPMLLNEEYNANNRKILDDAINVYNQTVESYTQEKEHYEEQYNNLNESFRKSELECMSLKNELDRIKKEEDELLAEIDKLKTEINEKDSLYTELQEENKGKEEIEENIKKEEETNRIIEERAKVIAQEILNEEERKRLEKEEIERRAIENYKREHNIQEGSFNNRTNNNDVLQILSMRQMQADTTNKKEKHGFFRKKTKEEKKFYGYDLQTCITNAELNNAQMKILTYAIEHNIDENKLVLAINNNCNADQLKGLVEMELAKRMKDNKIKEQEEKEKHQKEVNDYGTYTQEDANYGE